MKRSIATVCLSGDLRQKIDAAARAGYDGIEIFENDLLLFDQSPAMVRKMVADAGLQIVALQPFRDFEGMPTDKRLKNFARAERKFDIMEQLGTDSLLICSNVSPHAIDSMSRCAEDLAELAMRAAKRGFKIGYEALAWGRYIKDYQQAWELVKMADQRNLGIILDSFHIFARGHDLSVLNTIPGDRITLVQIADAPYLDMDVLQWSRHYRCFPGQGDFPVVEFMRSISHSGYDGYISHEIFNDEFRAAPSEITAKDGIRSLMWLQEETSIAEPSLPKLFNSEQMTCPPPNIERVEFIEFAVGEERGKELITLLGNFGFMHTHQHKSKDVSLYRQGEICIVVNQEPDSFAQSFNSIHGTSVCAIAYLCADAKAMMDRAAYYGYSRFDYNIEAGEMEIPAIRAVDGKLVYFVQKDQSGKRFFDVDFEPVARDTNPDSGQLLAVDHIAEGMSVNEFLPTSLFFKVLYGLDITQPQDLVDPYGIVVSRTATSRDKKIRIPFNMTRSWGASTQRFMDAHKGAGVQHIAFNCDNIFAVVEAFDSNLLLPIPDNYYDDLDARFGLEPEFLNNLRRYNLLYDQNEAGHFIHFYSQEINGLFFEAVQRVNYNNYGELNAPVRMAAQSRLHKSR